MSQQPTCPHCDDTGVIETGNNDLPCHCPKGDTAVFNSSFATGPVTGAELKRPQGWNAPSNDESPRGR